MEKYYDDIKKVEVSLKVVKPETARIKRQVLKFSFPVGNFTQVKCVILLRRLSI
ncbi:ribosome hibernation protein YhbH [Bacteroides pyogenes JCM 10003]|nr:ribosome hibernation protein YhbH [Bacteroides pyogenes JCM 10003]